MLLKRAFDVTIALAALVALVPLFLLVALLVRSAMGRPLLFGQRRVGKSGELFTLYKFRTMREAFDAEGRPLPDEQRVTRLGAILRRFRLDEMPGFVAVLTGRMSMVGPRPLPPRVLQGLPGARERTQFRPGFTGLAQVSGNTRLTNHEKIAIDLYYVSHWSIKLDAVILLKTLLTLLRGEKRNEPLIGHAMSETREQTPSGFFRR